MTDPNGDGDSSDDTSTEDDPSDSAPSDSAASDSKTTSPSAIAPPARRNAHASVGPFELRHELADGGMGVVWRGHHGRGDVPVAVKFITEALRDRRRYRHSFRTEVRSVAALNHPGVITILDYGMTDPAVERDTEGRLPADCPYLVMELANAGSIQSLFGELRWPMFRGVMLELLDALSHAHAKGVVHRDIKPGNVLLDRSPTGALRLKLTDFGLAFLPDAPFDEGGDYDATCGTPQYMAPEQFRARWREFGPCTDLYGLGCLAWQMATGAAPYTGDSLMSIARKHLVEPLPDWEPLPEFEAAPDGLLNWLVTLLQKHPRDRFQTAADAAAALLALEPKGADRPAALPSRLLDRGDTSFEAHWSPSLISLRLDEGSGGAALPDSLTDLASSPVGDGDTESDEIESDQTDDTAADPPPAPFQRVPLPVPEDWSRRIPPPRAMPLIGAGLELFGLRDYPVVGRDPERDALWEQLQAVGRTGQPRAVLLHGPAGVGKTRLGRWIGERAAEVGAATSLRVVHDPNASPLESLCEVLARRLGCQGLSREDCRERLADWYRRHGADEDYEWRAMATLLVGDGRTDGASDVQFSDRSEKIAVLHRFFDHLAAERPVVLHLDDVPWGRGSLELVRDLLEASGDDGPAVLTVATYRDETLVERPLESQLVDRLGEAGAAELSIGPLDDAAQRRLIQQFLRLAPAAAHRVAARAQGNPLFATQLVNDWVDRGVLAVGEEGFELVESFSELPDDIYTVWSTRVCRALEGLGEAARHAVELGAVLSRHPGRQRWRAACRRAGLPFPEQAVEEMLRHRLLEDRADGWTFVHNMLRETLHRLAREAGRWERWNRVCAELLETSDWSGDAGLAERLAHHHLEAGQPDNALGPLLEAVDRRGSTSDLDAAAHLLETFEAAAADIGLQERDPRHAEYLLMRNRLRVSRSEDAGIVEDMHSLLERDFGDQTQLLHGRAHGILTVYYEHCGNFEDGLRHAEAAEKCLQAVERPQLAAQVAQNKAIMLAYSGHPEQAREYVRSILTNLGDEALQSRSRLYRVLGDSYIHGDDPETARKCHEKSLELAQEGGLHQPMCDCHNSLGDIARMEGDFETAERHYAQALRIARLLDSPDVLHIEATRAQFALAKGEFREARGLLDELMPRFEAVDRSYAHTVTRAIDLLADAGTGRWRALERKADAHLEAFDSSEIATPEMIDPLDRAARLAAEDGRMELAKKIGATARTLWERLNKDDRAADLADAVTPDEVD